VSGPTRFRACLVAMVVVAAACGPATGPPAPSAGGEPSSAGSSSVAGGGASSSPGAIANAPTTPGPFGRHDTPPGGIAEFVAFEGGAGGFCGRVGSGPPSVSLGLRSLPAAMCALDFPPGETVDMTLTRPGEFEWRNQVVADELGVAEWDLADLPDPIEGDYTMLASQGDIHVEMTQTLEVNTLEAMFLPVPIRIGETGWMVLAGGLPLASAPAYLYYAPEDGFIWPDGTQGYKFVADVGPVELNAIGEGRIAFTPRAGDPVGMYMVVVNPRPAGLPTPEPSLPTLASVTADDLTALADAYGMTCADSNSWIECNGIVGGVGVIMTIPTNEEGRLIGAWARALGPSDDVLPMFGELARIASGASEPEDWVRSATQWFKHRFGDVEVTLMDDLDGTWDIHVDPFTGSPTREVTATFAVDL
jgi:hypothetical protein